MYEDHGKAIFQPSTGRRIPKNEKNRHYREYLAWVAAGNTPDQPPTPTPRVTTQRDIDIADAQSDVAAANSLPELKAALVKVAELLI